MQCSLVVRHYSIEWAWSARAELRQGKILFTVTARLRREQRKEQQGNAGVSVSSRSRENGRVGQGGVTCHIEIGVPNELIHEVGQTGFRDLPLQLADHHRRGAEQLQYMSTP